WLVREIAHGCVERWQVSAVLTQQALETRHAVVVRGDGSEVGVVQTLLRPIAVGRTRAEALLQVAKVAVEAREDRLLPLAHRLFRNLLRVQLRETAARAGEQRDELLLPRATRFVSLQLVVVAIQGQPALQASLLDGDGEGLVELRVTRDV